MIHLNQINDIGAMEIILLAQAGIQSGEQLLTMGGTARGRQQISQASGIEEQRLLGWIKWADLVRLKGLDQEQIDCLERVGIESLADLAHSEVDTLQSKLEQSACPTLLNEAQLADWIAQARELPRLVHL